jgi:hypothetical protein
LIFPTSPYTIGFTYNKYEILEKQEKIMRTKKFTVDTSICVEGTLHTHITLSYHHTSSLADLYIHLKEGNQLKQTSHISDLHHPICPEVTRRCVIAGVKIEASNAIPEADIISVLEELMKEHGMEIPKIPSEYQVSIPKGDGGEIDIFLFTNKADYTKFMQTLEDYYQAVYGKSAKELVATSISY